jgi:hypothetical protein
LIFSEFWELESELLVLEIEHLEDFGESFRVTHDFFGSLRDVG